ncbi:MAG: DUF2510 domain-containing protein [Microbacterium sp.]
MTSKPPGWYDDGRGALRWWDGTQWTEHVAVPDPESGESAPDGGIDDLPVELQGDDADDRSDGASGAFGAATESKKSKLWIVWAALGVVLLGIVVAIAVVVPLLFLAAQRADGPAAGDLGPLSAEQQAAVDAVDQYNAAWIAGDCEDYTAVTTQNFRELQGNIDCAAFAESTQFFNDTVDDYASVVTGIDRVDAAYEVSTTDDYISFLDDDGNVTETPESFVDHFTYTLVAVDDGWAIDAVR